MEFTTSINYSVDYFEALSLAKADKNLNGKIDKDEQSVFDTYWKTFDYNKDNVVDVKDVEMYKANVVGVPEQDEKELKEAEAKGKLDKLFKEGDILLRQGTYLGHLKDLCNYKYKILLKVQELYDKLDVFPEYRTLLQDLLGKIKFIEENVIVED